jgi:opacity protein-like surface antigen
MGSRRAPTLAAITGRGLLGGLAVLLGLALPATARDPAADDYSPYAPSGFFVFDWSGFYVGGHLGLGHAQAESTETIFPDDPFNLVGVTYGQSETSVTGGVQAGWQRQFGTKLVVGVEAGFSLLRFDTTEDSPLAAEFPDLLPALRRSVEVGDIFMLTARLGYTDGRWLAYAKGGLASAEVDVGYRDLSTGATTSSGGRETGWTAGVGIDYALTQNLFLGIEYNYVHFRADITPPVVPVVPTDFSDVEVDIQNVVVRLNYRFGSGCCVAPGGP